MLINFKETPLNDITFNIDPFGNTNYQYWAKSAARYIIDTSSLSGEAKALAMPLKEKVENILAKHIKNSADYELSLIATNPTRCMEPMDNAISPHVDEAINEILNMSIENEPERIGVSKSEDLAQVKHGIGSAMASVINIKRQEFADMNNGINGKPYNEAAVNYKRKIQGVS